MPHLLELFNNATSAVTTTMTLEDDSYQRRQLSILFFEGSGLCSLPGIKRSSVVPLLKWFEAIVYRCRPEPIFIAMLAKNINVTYATAWKIAKKILDHGYEPTSDVEELIAQFCIWRPVDGISRRILNFHSATSP